MANSLLKMMGGAPTTQPQATISNMETLRQAAQSAKRMMGMLNTVKNPQQTLMQVAQQNPQLNAVMQMCNGRNPQEVFYEECKKHNINPDDVMNLLKG